MAAEQENTNYNEPEKYADFEVVGDDYGEVLQLTEYTGNGISSDFGGNSFVVAEYENINAVTISVNQTKLAKRFIQSIERFILDFDDIDLTEDHKKYIKYIGQLELSKLSDLLTLVEINKQMLTNMVHRINSVQIEDYAMVNTYNSLVNQHLKLHKELSNTYKNVPLTMRKMRLDVIQDPTNMITNESDGVMTEDFGETQFNNSKQLLKKLKEDAEARNNTDS